MECATCGGSDFIKESGYFYCSECQTQSQEVREHVFQQEISEINTKSTKKIRESKNDNPENKITSWECYNIIMASLTNELIELGADKSIKPIIKCLWMEYLVKLEVINLVQEEVPKLSIVRSKRDSEILYGLGKKRKKRGRSLSEGSVSEMDSTTIRRERSRKKRALVQVQYDEFSQQSNQESASLHNETLTSLKSGSDKSGEIETKLHFNRYSMREFRKHMSKKHFTKHKADIRRDLKCHRLSITECSNAYKYGVHYVSPIKLYCILYLGLLINREDIQLGDLLRFIREGHLTFNKYTDLFPESYTNKYLNIQNNSKNNLFSNKRFRVAAAKLATFLNIIPYIKMPDLVKLSERYCKELNLPDEVFMAMRNFISKTLIKLKMDPKRKIIPNYEARVMALIIFTLKLLYGLDGKTEDHLSKYAQLVNENNLSNTKMFNIRKWLEYIGYRRLVVNDYHFPSSDVVNSEVDSDLLLQYIKSHNIEFEADKKLTKEMKDYKEILTRIKDAQYDYFTHVEYPPSLTPFLDYSKIIEQTFNPHLARNIFNTTFQEESLDFLLRPNPYLAALNNKTEIHGGANDNWVMQEMKTYRSVNKYSKNNNNLVTIEIVKSGPDKNLQEVIEQNKKIVTHNLVPEYVQKQYQDCRKKTFKENAKHVRMVSKGAILKSEKADIAVDCYPTHYNPYERYWLYIQMNSDLISKKDFEQFYFNFSSSFKLVFEECARIIEQSVLECYGEFQLSELYLVYVAMYPAGNHLLKPQKKIKNNFSYYIKQAESLW
ncbi:unnamed protein product [Phaedon cochleariae]|uniref:Rrn7/TAF1B C-terminal cyclin domain-containing protein n=1 Tax=Phaedon cochleariae TaxID=80249 RepID=A0A9P0DVK6_PHACE|nr:unnamed protein product [Phaedon cochleariae]